MFGGKSSTDGHRSWLSVADVSDPGSIDETVTRDG
jgi:hypothetical protein